jgi:hypothetical protein
VKGRWDNAGHGVQVDADCGGHLVTVGTQVQGGEITKLTKPSIIMGITKNNFKNNKL